jgi:glucose/arabinose dehydrogenase
MAQPVHHWTPSIAVSGMAFITSDRYPGWKGDMVVGALKAQRLERIRFEGNKISKVEHLLTDLSQRVRDVRQGPDGWLYVLTDHSNGQLLRLVATP